METHLEAMTSKKGARVFLWSDGLMVHDSSWLVISSGDGQELELTLAQLRKLILQNLSCMSWLARKMIQCLSRKKQFLYGRQAILFGIIFKHFESPYDIVTSCQIISGHILLKYRSYCLKYHEIVLQSFWCAQKPRLGVRLARALGSCDFSEVHSVLVA